MTKYALRNSKSRVTFSVKHNSNENLKFSGLRNKDEENAYRERLSKVQVRTIAKPRLINWDLFVDYECENAPREMIMSYTYPGDGDTFVDLSWE